MRTRTSALLLACYAMLACFGCNQPVNPHVEWPPGADWSDYGAPQCSDQCAKLRAFGCREGGSTPGGIACESSCQTLAEKHIWPKSNVTCISAAKSVDDVRNCGVECAGK